MRHQFHNLPSARFMRVMLMKYTDQRVEFELLGESRKLWLSLLLEAGFKERNGLRVNGIYLTTFKRPRNWPKCDRGAWFGNIEAPKATTFFMTFRDCVFKQGDLEATCFGQRRYGKKHEVDFEIFDVGSNRIMEYMRRITPKLENVRD